MNEEAPLSKRLYFVSAGFERDVEDALREVLRGHGVDDQVWLVVDLVKAVVDEVRFYTSLEL
jgi:hypothetical protein